LDQNIKEFESKIALTDQSDGLIFYQRIVSIAPKILRPNGHLVLEVGKGEHPKKVYNLFSSDIFGHPKLIKDYNGDDRVLIVQSF
jgi:release factor glutamine methyltransferase